MTNEEKLLIIADNLKCCGNCSLREQEKFGGWVKERCPILNLFSNQKCSNWKNDGLDRDAREINLNRIKEETL